MNQEGFRWYAILTKSKQENRAEDNLTAQGVEVFAPKVHKCYSKQCGWNPSYKIKPLFPRYIFARFNLSEMLHKVSFTRGVQKVVGFAEGPTPIDEEIILMIQSRVGPDTFVRIGEEFKPGDRVTIVGGPLKSFAGIFEREMKDTDRVMILLSTIGYQARIVIERELLNKVA